MTQAGPAVPAVSPPYSRGRERGSLMEKTPRRRIGRHHCRLVAVSRLHFDAAAGRLGRRNATLQNNPPANGATGANGNMSATGQGAVGSGLANGQMVGNSANTRPMNQGYSASGNFQNNFTNTGVPSGGLNQNSSAGNIQPASYSQNQAGAGLQQTGNWATNQSSAAGSAAGRTTTRNTDDSSSGNGISASTPPPSFPATNNAGGSSLQRSSAGYSAKQLELQHEISRLAVQFAWLRNQ